MTKQLCELKKVLKRDLDAYIRLVDRPTVVCKSCGRVANDKKNVCTPLKLKATR